LAADMRRRHLPGLAVFSCDPSYRSPLSTEGFVMPLVTLPDGSKRQFDAPVSVRDVAASIGAGLAKAALAGRVDGVLVDTSS
jgi:hypothetical protein